MANIYVNKSGDDSNGGTSPADAYLTIQKAIDESGDGDTIYVGYGEYAEYLDFSSVLTNDLTIECDQNTILDAAGHSYGITASGSAYSKTIKNLTIKNADQQLFYNIQEADFYNCTIEGATFIYSWRTGTNLYFFKCFFKNGTITSRLYGPQKYEKCDFLNILFNAQTPSVSCDLDFLDCYFDADTILNLGLSDNADDFLFQNCCVEAEDIRIDGVTYTSYADAKIAHLSKFSECFDLSPNFDANYCPAPWSPLIDNGSVDYVGARRPANFYSPTSELFYGAIIDGWSFNGLTLAWELDLGVTEGTICSAVLNFGASQNIREIIPYVEESYRSDVLDSGNADVPNNLTFEYYLSETIFTQKNASDPDWVTAEWLADNSVNGAYFQMKITGRNDGVEA